MKEIGLWYIWNFYYRKSIIKSYHIIKIIWIILLGTQNLRKSYYNAKFYFISSLSYNISISLMNRILQMCYYIPFIIRKILISLSEKYRNLWLKIFRKFYVLVKENAFRGYEINDACNTSLFYFFNNSGEAVFLFQHE